ncbi:prolyl aminopeptidase [Candidatus Entotheonella palauensis]|uniref:Proline iminopeptidase n=1 Tax=Candidatus Entotheonella gemina TaxID=1429439 RepID=W4LF94_9BACT|nr:prolyl aminopeptidase [Candidatus Entotheonella palauensis]ETW96011.1 MAG: proline iminopeptidase [Candidatus Entotheonella gemina]
MTALYPEIEPHGHGMLDVGDGNLIYWEVCGDPNGKPALVLHGGPGSGCSTGLRRYFDPSVYRIVLFDQRGCGRSVPRTSDLRVNLSANTTEHLLADIERLRQHLGIDRWLVFGGSWGSTLGLAYAQRNPHRVTAIVLAGVTTTRRSEIEWLYRGVAPLFPEQWARFHAGVPVAERDGDLVAAYHRLLQHPNPSVHLKAAKDWCDWESALVSVDPDARVEPRRLQPDFQLAFARIVTHYFHHHAWLEDGILLRRAGSLAGIPGILIHGRLDLAAPLVTAWELAHAWPGSELVIVSRAGHATTDPGMSEAVIAATDRFRQIPS